MLHPATALHPSLRHPPDLVPGTVAHPRVKTAYMHHALTPALVVPLSCRTPPNLDALLTHRLPRLPLPRAEWWLYTIHALIGAPPSFAIILAPCHTLGLTLSSSCSPFNLPNTMCHALAWPHPTCAVVTIALPVTHPHVGLACQHYKHHTRQPAIASASGNVLTRASCCAPIVAPCLLVSGLINTQEKREGSVKRGAGWRRKRRGRLMRQACALGREWQAGERRKFSK